MSAVDAATVHKLREELGGEADVMRELIDTFLGEAPRLVEAMREGIARGNVRELNRAAHSLKSTAGTFGAWTLSTMCRELEDLTARGMPADAAARVAAIEAEWSVASRELAKLRP